MEETPFSWELLVKYFAGECTRQESEEIEIWRKSRSQNDHLLMKYEDLWHLSANNSPDFSNYEEEDWSVIKNATIDKAAREKNSNKPFFYYFSRIAASIVLAFFIAFFLYKSRTGNGLNQEFATTANTKVELEDGTVIWLNKNSKISYPEKFEGKTREVYLQGEGFFEVAHNPARPFIVHSGNTITKVLGTSFNVDENEVKEEISVNVVTGKVAFSLVRDVDKRVELTPGEIGIWSKINGQVIEKKGDPNQMAWHTGILLFEKTTMESIANTLAAYYDVRIEFADASIGNCRFTGTFQKAELDEILKTLSLTLGITYDKVGDKIIIKGEGC